MGGADVDTISTTTVIITREFRDEIKIIWNNFSALSRFDAFVYISNT